jgi:hypothetical protein
VSQNASQSSSGSLGHPAEASVGKYALDRVYRGAVAKEMVVGCLDSKLRAITFEDYTVPLANVVVLMSVLSRLRPHYSLKRNCCYWYARATMDQIGDVFPTGDDRTFENRRTKLRAGTWHRFRYFDYAGDHQTQVVYFKVMDDWHSHRLMLGEARRERQGDICDKEHLDSGNERHERYAVDSGKSSGNVQRKS